MNTCNLSFEDIRRVMSVLALSLNEPKLRFRLATGLQSIRTQILPSILQNLVVVSI